ncbi:hypothetical protein ACE1OE_04090 [Vibrio sp. E150_011]
MRALLTALSALVILAYPFAVYFGVERFGIQAISGVLVSVFVIRILSSNKVKLKEFKHLAWVSGLTGITLSVLGVLFKQHGWLTFYPVVVNLCMLTVFAISLTQPQSIIERFARLQQPSLPESAIRYTRNVTKVWCGFFVINASIALYTCFQSLEIWTLYNGLISYLAAGSLFAAEWIIRQFVRED